MASASAQGEASSGASPESDFSWRKIRIATVCLIGTMFATSLLPFSALTLLMLPMVTELGWSRTEFSSALTVMMWSGALLVPVFGRLSDRGGGAAGDPLRHGHHRPQYAGARLPDREHLSVLRIFRDLRRDRLQPHRLPEGDRRALQQASRQGVGAVRRGVGLRLRADPAADEFPAQFTSAGAGPSSLSAPSSLRCCRCSISRWRSRAAKARRAPCPVSDGCRSTRRTRRRRRWKA